MLSFDTYKDFSNEFKSTFAMYGNLGSLITLWVSFFIKTSTNIRLTFKDMLKTKDRGNTNIFKTIQ